MSGARSHPMNWTACVGLTATASGLNARLTILNGRGRGCRPFHPAAVRSSLRQDALTISVKRSAGDASAVVRGAWQRAYVAGVANGCTCLRSEGLACLLGKWVDGCVYKE